MKFLTVTAAAALTLGLAACGGKEASDNSAASAAENLTTGTDANDMAATDTNVMMNGGAVATMPTTAAEFANMAAASDQFEIKTSQLAATQASSPAIKSYAAMMIKDHTKSTNELKTAAAQGTPKVTPAPALNAEQQSTLDALVAAKGAAFDTAYAQGQVTGHQNTLALLQGYAARGDQPALKAFAAKMTPIVEAHLKQAQTLAK